MEAVAKLRNHPTSPRKMRLLADEIRGMQVEKALALLEHHPQHSATPLHKLLWSAVKNWEQKNEGQSAADASLIVKTVFVDGARTLKRMRPAPQGRGYRVRKRSNHVTVIVDTKVEEMPKEKKTFKRKAVEIKAFDSNVANTNVAGSNAAHSKKNN
jgi:large subunit ribosomal protein L22